MVRVKCEKCGNKQDAFGRFLFTCNTCRHKQTIDNAIIPDDKKQVGRAGGSISSKISDEGSEGLVPQSPSVSAELEQSNSKTPPQSQTQKVELKDESVNSNKKASGSQKGFVSKSFHSLEAPSENELNLETEDKKENIEEKFPHECLNCGARLDDIGLKEAGDKCPHCHIEWEIE